MVIVLQMQNSMATNPMAMNNPGIMAITVIYLRFPGRVLLGGDVDTAFTHTHTRTLHACTHGTHGTHTHTHTHTHPTHVPPALLAMNPEQRAAFLGGAGAGAGGAAAGVAPAAAASTEPAYKPNSIKIRYHPPNAHTHTYTHTHTQTHTATIKGATKSHHCNTVVCHCQPQVSPAIFFLRMPQSHFFSFEPIKYSWWRVRVCRSAWGMRGMHSNLVASVTKEQLQEIFGHFGTVKECTLSGRPRERDERDEATQPTQPTNTTSTTQHNQPASPANQPTKEFIR
jgi:hypothetical protein